MCSANSPWIPTCCPGHPRRRQGHADKRIFGPIEGTPLPLGAVPRGTPAGPRARIHHRGGPQKRWGDAHRGAVETRRHNRRASGRHVEAGGGLYDEATRRQPPPPGGRAAQPPPPANAARRVAAQSSFGGKTTESVPSVASPDDPVPVVISLRTGVLRSVGTWNLDGAQEVADCFRH